MYWDGLEHEINETALFCVICDSVFCLNDVIRSPSYTPPFPLHTHNTTQRSTTQHIPNIDMYRDRSFCGHEARDLRSRNMIFYLNLGRVVGCCGEVSVSSLSSVKIRDVASKLFMSTTFQIITHAEFFVAFTSRRFSGGFNSTDRKPLMWESGVRQ